MINGTSFQIINSGVGFRVTMTLATQGMVESNMDSEESVSVHTVKVPPSIALTYLTSLPSVHPFPTQN